MELTINHQELAAEKGVDLEFELTRGYAARLIRRKARQLVGKSRFTATDRMDLEQDLTITILERLPKFDPQVRHWNVFVKVVIDHRVATILESRSAQKCEHSQNITSLSTQIKGEDGEWTELGRTIADENQDAVTGRVTRQFENQIALVQDVEGVLANLTADQRDLCERLKTASLSQVARDLGVPRSTLNDRLSNIRQQFEAAGLNGFLAPDR